MINVIHTIGKELREHAPFTMFGAGSGIAILAIIVVANVPSPVSKTLFWTLHPIHVIFSALATAGMYKLYRSRSSLLSTVVIGYVGAIGIATLSDSVIPYLGEILLDLPNRGIHLGFIEKWWLINPLALFGVGIAYIKPRTKIPHFGHVLLSTWASLFHIVMALGEPVGVYTVILIGLFLFAAVWVPCCTSDIIFPLLFAREKH